MGEWFGFLLSTLRSDHGCSGRGSGVVTCLEDGTEQGQAVGRGAVVTHVPKTAVHTCMCWDLLSFDTVFTLPTWFLCTYN